MGQIDGGQGVVQGEAVAGEGFGVAGGVEVGEAVFEFEGFPGDGQAAEGACAGKAAGLGEIFEAQGKIPADAGSFEIEDADGAIGGSHVDFKAEDRAEDPNQHVEEMDADVGGDAAGFGGVALPGIGVPFAAGGDLGQLDVQGRGGGGVRGGGVWSGGGDAIFEGADGRVKPRPARILA